MEQKFMEYTLGNFIFFNFVIPTVFCLIAYMVGKQKGRNE